MTCVLGSPHRAQDRQGETAVSGNAKQLSTDVALFCMNLLPTPTLRLIAWCLSTSALCDQIFQFRWTNPLRPPVQPVD